MKYTKQCFSGDLILILNIFFAGNRALEAVWKFKISHKIYDDKNSNSFLL